MAERPVAIVTGAARGIGRTIAEALLTTGWRVLITDIDAAAGFQAERALAERGQCRFLPTDVGDEPTVAAMVSAALEASGRLDALVNNAGVMISRPVTELSLAEWNRVIDTNLTGAFLCAKHAAPALRAAQGAIINIASTRAFMSEPDTEAYAASKGGLVALTHALAISLGPAVRVNCVSPGWIQTGDYDALGEADHAQHPVGRVGRPADVAEAVLFLLSDKAGFATGTNLILDGGMTRKMIYV